MDGEDLDYITEVENNINKNFKEVIELMLQLDDDKNYSLSDIERDKYAKMLKRL